MPPIPQRRCPHSLLLRRCASVSANRGQPHARSFVATADTHVASSSPVRQVPSLVRPAWSDSHRCPPRTHRARGTQFLRSVAVVTAAALLERARSRARRPRYDQTSQTARAPRRVLFIIHSTSSTLLYNSIYAVPRAYLPRRARAGCRGTPGPTAARRGPTAVRYYWGDLFTADSMRADSGSVDTDHRVE